MENNNSQELFKKNIKRIIDLENEEKQLKDTLNRIKEQKDKLNDNLISFMETNNITTKDIIYGDKKIKYIRTKNTEGITKKLIYEKLKNYFQSDKSATEAIEYIYKDRQSEYKTTIKITDVKNK
jgi:hypothetical protein